MFKLFNVMDKVRTMLILIKPTLHLIVMDSDSR